LKGNAKRKQLKINKLLIQKEDLPLFELMGFELRFLLADFRKRQRIKKTTNFH
jgi:hypothetical protein